MDQIWWNKIPNTLAFITAISEDLQKEKSVLIHSVGKIPWFETMRMTIQDSVRQANSSKRFKTVQGVPEPGSFLLSEYCKAEKRAQYRPAMGYAKFFAGSDDIVLHSMYFWVKISTHQELEAWLLFVSDYVKDRGKDKEKAAFILEWHGTELPGQRKGITQYSLDRAIGSYDRLVFAMLAASVVEEKTNVKNYLAELAANVVGNDIELCAKCIADYRSFLKNPFDTVNRIVEESWRSDDSAFTFLKDQKTVEGDIWRAQIKILYPIIEEYRENFVDKYAYAIERALPITSTFGEQYTYPRDVELGTLSYMAANSILTLNFWEHQKLELFKVARNKLSHLNVLTIDEVRELLT